VPEYIRTLDSTAPLRLFQDRSFIPVMASMTVCACRNSFPLKNDAAVQTKSLSTSFRHFTGMDIVT
jgi:hypothetical protein